MSIAQNRMIDPPSHDAVPAPAPMSALDRVRRDLTRADQLQHTVAVVGKEDLRAILAVFG